MKTSLKGAQKSNTAFPFGEGFLQAVPDHLRTGLHHLGAPAPNPRGADRLRRALLLPPSPRRGPPRSRAAYAAGRIATCPEAPPPRPGQAVTCGTQAHPSHRKPLVPPPNTPSLSACAAGTEGARAAFSDPKRNSLNSPRGGGNKAAPQVITAEAECSSAPRPSPPAGPHVPRRGGATRSLRTQAQSPSNTPLRSISQWGRARGSCSKVNRRQRPRGCRR